MCIFYFNVTSALFNVINTKITGLLKDYQVTINVYSTSSLEEKHQW